MLAMRRLGYALGAEIEGIDLSAPLDELTLAAIEAAWCEYAVLCFPGQDLSPEQQVRFASAFGEIDSSRLKHIALDGNPGVTFLANRPVAVGTQAVKATRADGWHTDLSFSDAPGTATFLLATQLPSIGGDTMFANTYSAYETLSPRLQQIVDELEAVHDVRLTISFPDYSPELKEQRIREHPPVVHPLVRVHPQTGRKALFVGATVRNFVGMTEEESRPLRDYLMGHATRYEFTYRHRWRVGDLLMWDNRCTMHYAVPDYDPHELRTLQRCTLVAPKSGYFL